MHNGLHQWAKRKIKNLRISQTERGERLRKREPSGKETLKQANCLKLSVFREAKKSYLSADANDNNG